MKNKIIRLILTFIMITMTLLITPGTVLAADVPVPPTNYSSTLPSGYYNSVSNLTGTSLLKGLATLTLNNHKYYNTYGEAKGGIPFSDRSSTNSSQMIDFYSGLSLAATWDSTVWNREHIWPKNLSNGLYTSSTTKDSSVGATADIHQLRPSFKGINSSRGDSPYGEVEDEKASGVAKYFNTTLSTKADETNGTLYGYRQNDIFEPADRVKGDVARIIMYMYMHYSTEISTNSSHEYAGSLEITKVVSTSEGTKDAAFDLLVSWNEKDPVDAFEKSRNNYCASVTGTRNPFIDHPEYANAIWGDGILDGGDDNSGDSGNSGSGSGSSGSGTTTEIIVKEYYKKLTSAAHIANGEKVIITAANYDHALSTNQKTSNRGATTVTKYSDGTMIPSSDAQVLTVEKQTDGTFAFNTGSGYLCAGTSSSNELKTRTSITGNAKFTITISGGIATIIAGGSASHNVMRYNAQNNLFNCYLPSKASDQQDLSMYELVQEKIEVEVPVQPSNPSYEFPAANSSLTITKALEVANAAGTAFTTDKYQITGTVTDIANTTYGNMTMKGSDGKSIYVYGVYSSDGILRYDSMDAANKPQVGDLVTLSGILGVYESSTDNTKTPEMKNARLVSIVKENNVAELMQQLFNNYVSTKKYTKSTTINLNTSFVISEYFHASYVSLQRTTFYDGNALLMANYDGTLKGVNATSGINSGYGTLADGTMSHFYLTAAGEMKIDYTVAATGGMEEYYVTPYDFCCTNYFANGWKYDSKVGYIYDVTTTTDSYLKDFIAVSAPLLLEKVYTSGYVSISKLVVKEVNNTLVLQILINESSTDRLNTTAQTTLVLCEAIITAGNNSGYTFS